MNNYNPIRKGGLDSQSNMLTVASAVGMFERVRFPRLAESSKETYKQRLEIFLGYFDENAPLASIEQWHLEQYISSLYETRQLNPNNPSGKTGKYSKTTIANHVRVIRAFFSWCYQQALIDKNPADRLKVPDIREQPTRTVSDAHTRLLLNHLEQYPRDLAIVHLMLYSGLRVSEVVNIDIEDVDLTGRIISVKGKGAKPRYVPITNQTKTLLLTYILGFRPRGRALFASEGRRKKRKDNRLTRSGIRQMLERRCAAAGIPVYSPHQFRHTFATNAVKNGAGELWLQLVLGHEPGSKATRRYVHTSKEVLLKQFDLVVR